MERVLFFMVFVGVYFGLHVYIGRRLISSWSPPRHIAILGWSAIALHAVLSVGLSMARRLDLAPNLADPLQMVTYVLMGFMIMVFTLTVVRDVFLAILWVADRARGTTPPPDAPIDDPVISRRRFITGASSAAALGGAATASGAGFMKARKIPGVVEVDVPVQGLHEDLDGFAIVQLSDLHIGPTIKRPFLEGVVEKVNALNADVVAITGDLIDGHVERMEHDVAPVRDLKARHGVFYVAGNHEYYWDGPAWLAAAKPKFGMNALVNQHEVLRHGRALLVMGGVTDYSAERMVPEHASDPKKAIEGAPEDAFKVLLAHQPKSVYEAAEAGFDLQLSGHTHGGQFYPWNILVGMAHPFLKGLHRFEQKMWVYVSSGTGYWGPPLRLGAPSEITLLRLRRV